MTKNNDTAWPKVKSSSVEMGHNHVTQRAITLLIIICSFTNNIGEHIMFHNNLLHVLKFFNPKIIIRDGFNYNEK